MEATYAGAQAPAPPPPPPAPAPAAPAEPAPPATPPAAPPAAATPPASPATPAAPAPGNWWDKFSADAFVDAYGSINYNFPKPQGPIAPFSAVGGNAFHALDTAEGFSVNWAGVNVSYAADPIGFTASLRVGPGAIAYHAGTSDGAQGLQFVKQAYATWKVADKLTLDFGKWDQPYGSEVADSQLNMNYTRTLLWWYM
ncbi:MAG: outer membrane beta-barrel protein, partial [Myxococcales bacterium]|nr:outer membrane beta-barrel protein [Myxococcales bacterium]